jgi:hypothetical protein
MTTTVLDVLRVAEYADGLGVLREAIVKAVEDPTSWDAVNWAAVLVLAAQRLRRRDPGRRHLGRRRLHEGGVGRVSDEELLKVMASDPTPHRLIAWMAQP